jgi:WD40 repeat protein
MHTAPIRRIATDAAGRLAVTASDDKTARVWDVASGRLLQTLRIPVDQGP